MGDVRDSDTAPARDNAAGAPEPARALRLRKLIGDYRAGVRRGAYRGVAAKIDRYALEDKGQPTTTTGDSRRTAALSKVRARLNEFDPDEQGRLIDWGHALAAAVPSGFPIAAYPV